MPSSSPASQTSVNSPENYFDTCKALGVALVANVPVLIKGDPGQGKSSVIEQMALDYSMHCETVIASLCEPSDFAGLPIVDHATATARMAPPAWAMRLNDQGEKGGIQFFDEITTAPPAVQAALLRPILDKRVGELQLHPNVRTIAAANPPSVAADGWDLAPPVANRFLHLDWSLPAQIVADGFAIGWPTIEVPNPDLDRCATQLAEIKTVLGSFLYTRPEMVTVMPRFSDEAGGAFATPRSWEMVAKVLAVAEAANCNDNIKRLLVVGCVGVGPGAEFLEFRRSLDLPDPEALLADPSSYNVPSSRGDKVYAICASVTNACLGNLTPERWSAWGDILAATSAANHADVAYIFARRWCNPDVRPQGSLPTAAQMQHLQPILVSMGLLAAGAN